MIVIEKNASLDDTQQRVIFLIQPFTVGHRMIVTRGHSTPLEQLAILGRYAAIDGIYYPEFKSGNLDEKVKVAGYDGMLYRWQRTWSAELKLFGESGGVRGKKINPPIEAVCLFDYISNGHNKKGEMIKASPHIDSKPYPCPIDFADLLDSIHDITGVANILRQASAEAGIRSIVLEVGNRCVHVNLNLNRNA